MSSLPYNQTQYLPFLFAGVFEGIAIASIYGYGPLYMREVLGQSSLSVAALTIGLASFVGFIMAGVWGRLGDRTGNTTSLIAVGLAVAAGSLFLLPAVENAGVFVLLTVLVAGGMAACAPLGVAWLTLREPNAPGVAAARFYRSRTIGWAIGSYGTGYIVQMLEVQGLSIAFRIAALGALGVALWLTTLSMSVHRRAVQAPSGAGSEIAEPELPAHSDAAWRQPLVLAVAIAVLLGFGGNEAFFALMGPYFTEYLHGSAAWVGFAVGTASLVGVLVIGLVGRLADKRGPGIAFAVGSFGYTVIFGLMSVLRYPLPTIILFAVPLYPFVATGVTGLMVRYLPAQQRGEAIGIYEGSAALAAALGSVLGGALADMYGIAVAPVIAFAMALAGSLVAWIWVMRIPRRKNYARR